MSRRSGVVLGIGMILLAILFAAGPLHAQEPDGITAIITSPANGEQLFGQVQIRGSAAHPSAFANYRLEYDSLNEPAEEWTLVQPDIQQQVQDGVLGAWNTDFVPDGVYQLRLRVTLTDGQTAEYIVSNLRVVNREPTPIPTTETVIEPGVPPSGPSPTSPIDQPPSSHPDADIAGLVPPTPDQTGGIAVVSGSETPTRRINTGRIWRAFCSGVYLTLGAFGIMFAYLLLRGRLRPLTRRLLWQIQDDLDHR